MNEARKHSVSLPGDQRGATLIIALVFLLTGAIIASVILTAASVQAKTVQTHKIDQQLEYTATSAAQTIANELQYMVIHIDSDGKITYGDDDETFQKTRTTELGEAFWVMYGDYILNGRELPKQKVSINNLEGFSLDENNSQIWVTSDYSIEMELRVTDRGRSYKNKTRIQAIPTYDASGRLMKLEYQNATIERVGVK